jgi:hypothetical protein
VQQHWVSQVVKGKKIFHVCRHSKKDSKLHTRRRRHVIILPQERQPLLSLDYLFFLSAVVRLDIHGIEIIAAVTHGHAAAGGGKFDGQRRTTENGEKK